MGFWGTFVIHHGDQRLRAWLPGDIEDDGGRDHDGWQVTQVEAGLADLPAGFLTGLRDRTGAPVLVADVLDSSAVLVEGLGVRTPAWQVWLKPDSAIGYLGPDLEREVAVARAGMVAGAVAAPAAIAWAEEAGWEPEPPDRVSEILEDDDVFAEDVLFALLEALGLPPGEEVAPVPSIRDVLDGLTGRRLEGISAVAHRPGLADLLLRFDDGRIVAACCCADQLALLPTTANAGNAADGGAGLPAGPLTGWETIRYRNFPDLRGMVLHFADRPLLIAADSGEWTVVEATEPPEHLGELRLNRRPAS